ncbi:MAG: hypothetical protein ACRD6N_06905 [Pyrinomonadaceae bacterium]
MRASFRALLFGLLAVFAVQSALGQAPQAQPSPGGDPGITPNGAIGEVKAIDSASRQLIVKTDAGSLVTVSVAENTNYLRLPPGETTLTKATKIALSDIGEGDRVFARGTLAEDRKSVTSKTVIVMSKADIAKKQDEERAEWRRRGLLGVITALNPQTKEITVSSRSMGGMQPVVIPVAEKVEMRRYAPDSIKFSDAKTSRFEDLQVGDQLRALGDRSTDGTRFTAEKVVTGSFRTVAGTVTAIDAATGEVKINDLQTKQPLTIVIKHDAVLRRFPAAGEMGGMMMMGRGPGGGANAGAQPPAQGQPANRPQGAQGPGPGGPGMGRQGGGGFNIQEMLERLPTIAIADLKIGDTIVVSSTKGADPTRLTAISLVTGADTLLNMIAARQQQPGAGQAAPNPAGGLGQGFQIGIGLP